MRTLSGEPLDLALTTNGHLLDDLAAPLKAAGLNRVTVSMDAVDAATFERITRIPGSFATVAQRRSRCPRRWTRLRSRSTAYCCAASTTIRSKALRDFAREENVVVRFIEFMPLEEGRLWSPEIVVPLQGNRRAHRRVSCRSWSCRRAKPAKQRAATPSPTALARSASLRPSARPSAVRAAACGSPPTARFAPACSRRWNTTSTDECAQVRTTRNCAPTSCVPSKQKEARHHIGEPDFLKPSRSMVHIGG